MMCLEVLIKKVVITLFGIIKKVHGKKIMVLE